ncbi:MAG: 50S ribosomal protein L18 [Candidatus Muproteobacteria bacterium RBG_16_65_34]|uniref:Large ribosomal subunit protein uL18 n=1 Tax=Candidatus Muproteobacteria bacterium RBG_16_65_34 TaxID=1817760 RepID=A0A1F6TMD8_9PROT|nr:MAG: 50S ribosomal protein L18 [Candidatus Muproteobacteria bacterium RBG_16_65_34]
MNSKIEKRERRSERVRRKIRSLQVERLTVHRTPRHIYAQIVDKTGGRVLASASTLEREVRAGVKNGGNAEAARMVGKRIAEKAKAAGVTRVAFDRSGYMYHGRVKALADAAREGGLQF